MRCKLPVYPDFERVSCGGEECSGESLEAYDRNMARALKHIQVLRQAPCFEDL